MCQTGARPRRDWLRQPQLLPASWALQDEGPRSMAGRFQSQPAFRKVAKEVSQA
jgi:hypothetical protein